jgi:hypothetical protein
VKVRTALVAVTLVVGCLLGAALVLPGGAVGRGASALPASTVARQVDGDGSQNAAAAKRLLALAVDASQSFAHRGRVTIVSFGESGPQVSELSVERDADEVRVEQLERGHLHHAATAGGTRATERLLRVAGLGDAPDQLGLLAAKYAAVSQGTTDLDTGPAAVLALVEHTTGIVRERLYLDAATGLVVRRETFDRAGAAVRVVAYVVLDAAPAVVPTTNGDPEREVGGPEKVSTSPQPVGVPRARAAALGVRDGDFVVPEELGAGYRLLAVHELPLDAQPAVHLLYGDGLYTLSLFQQEGRLASVGRRDAVALVTEHGGTVWRWPGSEPRHVVWTGDELTFTALTDAPTDELLAVIGALPNDPPATALDRVVRGFQRVGRWLAPGGDDPERARRDLRP